MPYLHVDLSVACRVERVYLLGEAGGFAVANSGLANL